MIFDYKSMITPLKMGEQTHIDDDVALDLDKMYMKSNTKTFEAQNKTAPLKKQASHIFQQSANQVGLEIGEKGAQVLNSSPLRFKDEGEAWIEVKRLSVANKD